MPKKISPIKEKPLSQAGESLGKAIDRKVNDDAVPIFLTMISMFALIVVVWVLFFFKWSPDFPTAIGFSLGGVGVICFSIYRIKKLKKVIENCHLGYDGERCVGDLLDELREDGAKIFHDIDTGKGNIDHVVVSENGVYALETKTRSKKGSFSKVTFDGDKINIGGFLDKKILTQAKGEAQWLHNFIQDTIKENLFVKPVILFPGWNVVNSIKLEEAKIWVLNPKNIRIAIKENPMPIDPKLVAEISAKLAEYVRKEILK